MAKQVENETELGLLNHYELCWGCIGVISKLVGRVAP